MPDFISRLCPVLPLERVGAGCSTALEDAENGLSRDIIIYKN
jgi:hypothetical protein